MTMNVREISEGEFAENCRELLDEVAATGDEIVVTAGSKQPLPPSVIAGADLPWGPGALREWVIAHANPRAAEAESPLKGSIVWQGDIVSPVGEEDWGLLP